MCMCILFGPQVLKVKGSETAVTVTTYSCVVGAYAMKKEDRGKIRCDMIKQHTRLTHLLLHSCKKKIYIYKKKLAQNPSLTHKNPHHQKGKVVQLFLAPIIFI